MKINELRNQIDRTDKQLVDLFLQRMELCKEIAIYKNANNLPVDVPGRELAVLHAVEAQAGEQMAEYIRQLYIKLFELSKQYQMEISGNEVK